MTRSIRIAEFDVWRPGYAGAIVTAYRSGTTTPASIYDDAALTQALPNPQTLQTRTDGAGNTYGKWAQPVYIGAAYELDITTGERTGVVRLPLLDLAGEDASLALVTPSGGTQARSLAAIVASVVRVESFGTFGASAGGNTDILAEAIGYAAGLGGGEVLVPAGTWEFNTLSIPQNVVVRGSGRGATILRSSQAQRIVTIAGDRAGLAGLTLDGINLIAASVGVYSVGRNDPILDDVEIKRFEIGLQMRGASRPRFSRFFISNCGTGADLRGDADIGGSAQGGAMRSLTWTGGKVDLCSTAGVILSFEDNLCEGVHLEGVDFTSNSGTALSLNGARFVVLDGGRFAGNTINLNIADDSDTSRSADNTIRSFRAAQTRFSGGQIRFDGICDDVLFDLCDFADVDFVLSIPTKPILLLDCQEDAATTAAGATEKLQRSSRASRGTFAGVTTDGNYITAWSLALEPGELVQLTVRATGRQRNGTNYLSEMMRGTAVRAAATVGFDLASGTITNASIVTGATSGASARVIAVTQSGLAGTLSVRDVKGIFEVGETLNTSAGETAKCVAPLNSPTTVVDPLWVASVGPVAQTDGAWDLAIDASSPLVRVRVRGAASQTVEWVVEIDALRP